MARRPVRARAPASRAGGWLLWTVVLATAAGVAWIWWHGGKWGAPEAAPPPGRREARDRESPPVRPVPRPLPEVLPPATGAPPVGPPPAVTNLPSPRTATNLPGLVPSAPLPSPGVSPSPEPAPVDQRAWLARDRVVALQLALARRGISSGPVDGVVGSQTRAALRVFQRSQGLKVTGMVDDETLDRLRPDVAEAYGWHLVSDADLARLTPVPSTWLGKSSRERLDFETILELVAERSQAHPRLVRQLNPGLDWHRIRPGTAVKVPRVFLPASLPRAAQIRIHLGGKSLALLDARANLLLHAPCSIARKVEKRPVGELRVVKVAPNPNYRFDPDIFPESAEGRQLGRRLMIPPGPNNPVGTVWIGLDRPGYGIHGTPHPEDVGRTESHGCFRLANWNAELLLTAVWVGLPVIVEP